MALTFRDSNGGNPLSFTQMDSNFRHFTGSFTNTGTITANAFAGDGSAITGVTAEWDGSHNGNANITGSLTVTQNITGSGLSINSNTLDVTSGAVTTNNAANITHNTGGDDINFKILESGGTLFHVNTADSAIKIGGDFTSGDEKLTVLGNISASGNLISTNITASGTITSVGHISSSGGNIYGTNLDLSGFATFGESSLRLRESPGIPASGILQSDAPFQSSQWIAASNITASGNISSSANVYGVTGSFSHLLGASPLTIQSDNLNLDSIGNITASGNISASGDIYSSMFRGEQLFLNSGSSQYLSNPASGDAALIAMSSSGAFAANSAITPNNLVLFSEYKTGDTGTVNGKAASSILFTVNHGASNGNNAVAQIACVAQGISSNYADLVFSTRGVANNVTERMRITQNKTMITGSLDVSGALSKFSGTFKIAHPISTGSLYHSFIEGPKCDLIYRGTTTLTNGVADINIDSVSNMTEGTFVALTQDPQLFLQNTTGWEPLKGSISENILSIECKSTSSADNISWMVVAERADDFIKNWDLTDENGHLIPEQ